MKGFGIGLENVRPYISNVVEDTADEVTNGFDNVDLPSPQLPSTMGSLKVISDTLDYLKEDTSSKEEAQSMNKIEQLLEYMVQLLGQPKQQIDYAVVLDDGTLVGKLALAMDRRLGEIYKMKRRGN